jgi:hypothetical protein
MGTQHRRPSLRIKQRSATETRAAAHLPRADPRHPGAPQPPGPLLLPPRQQLQRVEAAADVAAAALGQHLQRLAGRECLVLSIGPRETVKSELRMRHKPAPSFTSPHCTQPTSTMHAMHTTSQTNQPRPTCRSTPSPSARHTTASRSTSRSCAGALKLMTRAASRSGRSAGAYRSLARQMTGRLRGAAPPAAFLGLPGGFFLFFGRWVGRWDGVVEWLAGGDFVQPPRLTVCAAAAAAPAAARHQLDERRHGAVALAAAGGAVDLAGRGG